MVESKRVGRAIRTLREKAGYTQKELAAKLYVSDMAVSKWENGKSIPDISTLWRLSIVLDMDIEGFLDGTPAYLDEPWIGVFCPDSENECPLDYQLNDKPLIDFIMSYYLLSGIKRIVLCCSENNAAYAMKRFHEGAAIGVEMDICPPGRCSISHIVSEYGNALYERTHIMLITHPFFVYGPDLTRFIQRGMQNSNGIINLASVRGLGKNEQINIRSSDNPYRQYRYEPLPLYFLHLAKMEEDIGQREINEIIPYARSSHLVHTVLMNKGFLYVPLEDQGELKLASQMTGLIQRANQNLLCCPPEIAWRRGVLGTDEVKDRLNLIPEYIDYLKELVDAY